MYTFIITSGLLGAVFIAASLAIEQHFHKRWADHVIMLLGVVGVAMVYLCVVATWLVFINS